MGNKIVYSVEVETSRIRGETGVYRHPLFQSHLHIGKQGLS